VRKGVGITGAFFILALGITSQIATAVDCRFPIPALGVND
jgi:hypothetical protein